MTVLMSQYRGDGCLRGRCGASCHNAHGPVCKCICGGRFHGIGFTQAQRELTEQWESYLKSQYLAGSGMFEGVNP